MIQIFTEPLFRKKKINCFEQKKHGKIYFPIISAIELIKHLDSEDKAKHVCQGALYLLMNNCSITQERHIEVMPYIFRILSCYLGKNIYDPLDNYVIEVCNSIVKEGASVKSVSLKIESIKKRTDDIIETIINNIKEYYIPGFLSNENMEWEEVLKNHRKDFHRKLQSDFYHTGIAIALIRSIPTCERLLENPMTINKFKNDFPVSIDFFVQNIWRLLITDKEASRKILCLERDRMNKHPLWNSFYDMQLIFGTEYFNICNNHTIFVTEEKKIRKMFIDKGKGEYVINLKEYLDE